MQGAPERKPRSAVPTGRRSCLRIRVRGVVQGVGFRPMVWRVATDEGLTGYVTNDGSGVLILASGEAAALARLVERIESEAPPLARIEGIETGEATGHPEPHGFGIKDSAVGENRTRVTADASICAACLDEIRDLTFVLDVQRGTSGTPLM